jgi:PBP1b-binding outer membrane lipoprotein LpoB
MKILKHLVIFAFAAFIVVSCKKSDITPHKCGEKSQSQTTQTTPPADIIQPAENTPSSNESGRSSVIEGTVLEVTPFTVEVPTNGINPVSDPTDVSGSGDDDRDGGERKKRKR